MKAMRIHQYGGTEAMQWEDLPTPQPAAGEVLIKQDAIGINYIDTYQRSGMYKLSLPFTLGNEGAGVVAAVGAGVTRFKEGDKVCYNGSGGGAYAEYITRPADVTVAVPAALDTKIAASVLLQGMTAHYLCNSAYPIEAGQSCLVHAGAGGTGLLLIQMCKSIGATVYTTVSTPEKSALAKEAGADHTILYTEVDFAEKLLEISEGKKVDVVYDSVARTTFQKGLSVLRPRGYMVLYGQSSGKVPSFDVTELQGAGSLYVTRPTLVHYTQTREELDQRSGDVFSWVSAGKLKVTVGATWPLADAGAAHQALEGRKTTGKLLLLP